MLQTALFLSLLAFSVIPAPAEVSTGDLFLVAPESEGRAPKAAYFLDIEYAPIQLSNGRLFFLFGVDLDTKAGTYPLTYAYEDTPKRVSTDIKIVTRDFPVEEK